MKKNKTINININFGNIVKISLFLIFLYLLYEFKQLALIIVTAIVLASAIEPIIVKLQKIKVPRIVSVISVYVLIITFILIISWFFVPPLVEQTDNFIKDLPAYTNDVKSWIDIQIGKNNGMSRIFSSIQSELNDISFEQTTGALNSTTVTLKKTLIILFGGIFNFFLILILSFYFALQEKGVQTFLKIITPVKYTKYVLNLWKRTEHKISRWMQGQFLLGLLVGSLTYIGLKIFFDFDQTLLLAILAGFTELIPVIGPFIAAIPGIFIAFLVGGKMMALWVFVLYLVIQTIENNILYPLVVNKVVGVPSFLVIISLLIGSQLFGFLGIILSIPVAAAFMEYIKDLEKKQRKALKAGEEKEHPALF